MTIKQDTIPPRSRRRRWTRRLVVGGVLLVVLAGVAGVSIELVRRSDVPRRMIVSILETRTGLRVELGAADVGWMGETVLHDLVVRLPLEDAPLVTAPVVRARHPSFFAIAATGFTIDSVTLERPEVFAHEDDRGRWNLARAAEAIGKASAAPNGSTKPTPLPRVEIIDGAVEVQRHGMTALTLPLTLTGSPSGVLVWEFEGAAGGLRAAGSLATTTMEHEVRIRAANVEPVVELWAAGLPTPLEVEAAWDGSVTSGGLVGTLDIRGARAGEHRVQGRIGVGVEGGEIELSLSSLQLLSPSLPTGPLNVTAGVVTIDENRVGWQDLRANDAVNAVEIDGEWNLQSRRGQVTADWRSADEEKLLAHRGHATVNVSVPALGLRTIDATVRAGGRVGGRRWRAEGTIEGSGPRWERFRTSLAMSELQVVEDDVVTDLGGLRAEVRTDWPDVLLTSLDVPGAERTHASVRVNAETRAWSGEVELSKWSAPHAGGRQIDVRVSAAGDDKRAEIETLSVIAPEGRLRMSGVYDAGVTESVRGEVEFEARLPERVLAEDAGATGVVAGTLEVRGSASPLSLTGDGTVAFPELKVASGTLPAGSVPFSGSVDEEGARLHAASGALLGGAWRVDAAYDAATGEAGAEVVADDVQLTRLAEFAMKDLEVAGDIDLDLQVRVPDLEPDRLVAVGSWEVREMAAASEWPRLSGAGKIDVRESVLRLHDMALNMGDNADATITGGITVDARKSHMVGIDVRTTRWPVAIKDSPLAFLVDSHLDLEVDITGESARGGAEVDASVSLSGTHLAEVRIDGEVAGRTVSASSIRAELLGGSVVGSGVVPIDDWTRAKASLQVQGLDLAQIRSVRPLPVDVSGLVSGSIVAGPSEDSRALEPLQVAGEFTSDGGMVHGVSFGDLQFEAFAGPKRVVLNRSRLLIAGGSASVWSRLSWHDGQPFVHVSAEAADLVLAELLNGVDPALPHAHGKISFNGSMGGYTVAPHRAFGEAYINIEEADVVNLPVFTQLYSLLNVKFGESEPSGSGRVRLRIEDQSLLVSRFHYFNRGTDIVGSGRVQNVWEGTQSPIHGALAAAARPLKGSKLPFGSHLDRMLFAALKDAATVRIDGTVAEPKTTVVPFSEVAGVIEGAVVGRSAE